MNGSSDRRVSIPPHTDPMESGYLPNSIDGKAAANHLLGGTQIDRSRSEFPSLSPLFHPKSGAAT